MTIIYFVSNSPQKIGNRDLADLTAELEAKEHILYQMETDIENIVSNARPRCEGGSVEVTVDETPLIELREEIEDLKQRIADLEE